MTYNLHQGFNTEGQLDIEELARQIEAGGAEIVSLQEVPRGYLTTGSLDLVGWLANRLGMAFVFGPASDVQWGNAVLSRYPIVNAEIHPLPPQDLLLQRSLLRATIDIGAGEIVVIATHLHHIGADGAVRELQVAELLAAWDGAPGTVILGDLNGTPDAPEIGLLTDAGLLRASELWGLPAFTFPSTAAFREIDYICFSPDLAGSVFRIYQTTASDHLPVAVTLTIP
jgi:endonuclease/exonuclease/phosphatase family metal-dependent hydrolase